MAWVKIRGVKGLVYEPEQISSSRSRKHNCRDCFACRMCSDVCCESCLSRKKHLEENESE